MLEDAIAFMENSEIAKELSDLFDGAIMYQPYEDRVSIWDSSLKPVALIKRCSIETWDDEGRHFRWEFGSDHWEEVS